MTTCIAQGCTNEAWTEPDTNCRSVGSIMWRSPTGSITYSFPSKPIKSKLCFFHNMLKEQKLWEEEKKAERDAKKLIRPITTSIKGEY